MNECLTIQIIKWNYVVHSICWVHIQHQHEMQTVCYDSHADTTIQLVNNLFFVFVFYLIQLFCVIIYLYMKKIKCSSHNYYCIDIQLRCERISTGPFFYRNEKCELDQFPYEWIKFARTKRCFMSNNTFSNICVKHSHVSNEMKINWIGMHLIHRVHYENAFGKKSNSHCAAIPGGKCNQNHTHFSMYVKP